MDPPLSPSKHGVAATATGPPSRVILGEKSTNAPLSPRKLQQQGKFASTTTTTTTDIHTIKSPLIPSEQHTPRKRAFEEVDNDNTEQRTNEVNAEYNKVPRHAVEETPTEVATSPGAGLDEEPGSQSSTFAGLESLPSTTGGERDVQAIHASQPLSFGGPEVVQGTPPSSSSSSLLESENGPDNGQAPTPAQLLRLRLKLATFKLATNQTTTPFPSLDASRQPTRSSVLSPKLPVPPQRPVLKIQEGPAKTRWSARRRAREERRLGRYSVDASRRTLSRLVNPEVPAWVLQQKEERARQEQIENQQSRNLATQREHDNEDERDEREPRDQRMDSDADSDFGDSDDDDNDAIHLHHQKVKLPVPIPAHYSATTSPPPPKSRNPATRTTPTRAPSQQDLSSDASSESAEIIVTPRRARSHSPPSTRGRWRLASEQTARLYAHGNRDDENLSDDNNDDDDEDEYQREVKSSPTKHAPSSVLRAGAAGVLMSLGVVRD